MIKFWNEGINPITMLPSDPLFIGMNLEPQKSATVEAINPKFYAGCRNRLNINIKGKYD